MKPIDILGLKNFRIFDDEKGFLEELSSINILTGSNNSGKSSIVKALQLIKDSVKESKYPFDLDLNHQDHLLGDFDNILNDKSNRRIKVTLPFLFLGMKNLFVHLTFEVPESQNSYKAKLRAINVGDKTDQKYLFSFNYRDATLEEKEEYVVSFTKEKEEYDQYVNENNGTDKDIFAPHKPYFLFSPSENPLTGYIEWKLNIGKLKGYLTDIVKFYDIYLENKRQWNADSFVEVDAIAKDLYINPSSVVNSFKNDADPIKWKEFVENGMGNDDEITGKEHVGDRDYDPDDFYFPPYTTESILYSKVSDILSKKLRWRDDSGERTDYSVIDHCFSTAWDNLIQRILTINYISNNKEENARSYNAASNSPFVRLLKSYESTDFLDTNFIKKYLKAFEIGRKISLDYVRKYQNILVSVTTLEGDTRELVDFGYGIKQLILILVQISALAERNKSFEHVYDYEGESIRDRYDLSLLVIEEPEANLHPKWQSLLADMFVEANRDFNIQFIIETHSEYLIRRFQTLVAEKKFDAKNVKILYLRRVAKSNQDKNQVENIHIDEDGSIDFTQFDSGFFDESYNLNMSLLNIQFYQEFEELKNAKLESEVKLEESEAKVQKGKEKITEIEAKNHENETKNNLLQQRIDLLISKADVSVYRQIIVSRFIDVSKLNSLSMEYIVGGQYLLANINASADFSPVIMQYGRAIENELKGIFNQIAPTENWMIGPMQKCLEKLTNPSINLQRRYQIGFNGLQTELNSTFNVPGNLRIDLIEDLREIRNSAGHAGIKNTKQDALNYISMANDFLDKWISEKK